MVMILGRIAAAAVAMGEGKARRGVGEGETAGGKLNAVVGGTSSGRLREIVGIGVTVGILGEVVSRGGGYRNERIVVD